VWKWTRGRGWDLVVEGTHGKGYGVVDMFS
jgi:hypothetical protein